MNAHGQIAFGGKAKLREKNFFLTGVRQIRFPAVEADFADGAGNFVEEFFQIFLPVRRAFGQMPRMIAEARQHDFVFPRQREDLRPVVFARAVDDHAGDAGFFAHGEQFTLPPGKTVILQMIVRVVKFHGRDEFASAKRRKPGNRSIHGFLVSSIFIIARRKISDAFPDFGKRVAAVGREVLRDAERREKFRIVRENFRRRMAAVKFAEQAGDGLDDERIGIAVEKTFFVAELADEPQFGETAGNQICFRAKFRRERRTLFRLFNEERQPVLSVFQRGQLRGEFNLFFREVHGAEIFSIRVGRRFLRFRRAAARRAAEDLLVTRAASDAAPRGAARVLCSRVAARPGAGCAPVAADGAAAGCGGARGAVRQSRARRRFSGARRVRRVRAFRPAGQSCA